MSSLLLSSMLNRNFIFFAFRKRLCSCFGILKESALFNFLNAVCLKFSCNPQTNLNPYLESFYQVSYYQCKSCKILQDNVFPARIWQRWEILQDSWKILARKRFFLASFFQDNHYWACFSRNILNWKKFGKSLHKPWNQIPLHLFAWKTLLSFIKISFKINFQIASEVCQ